MTFLPEKKPKNWTTFSDSLEVFNPPVILVVVESTSRKDQKLTQLSTTRSTIGNSGVLCPLDAHGPEEKYHELYFSATLSDTMKQECTFKRTSSSVHMRPDASTLANSCSFGSTSCPINYLQITVAAITI